MFCLLHSCSAVKKSDESNVTRKPKGYLEIEGHYQGKNLYVQNPLDDLNRLCTYRITINDSIELDSADFHSSAYEINFEKYGFINGDKVVVKIYHYPDCMPKVLNPEVN